MVAAPMAAAAAVAALPAASAVARMVAAAAVAAAPVAPVAQVAQAAVVAADKHLLPSFRTTLPDDFPVYIAEKAAHASCLFSVPNIWEGKVN